MPAELTAFVALLDPWIIALILIGVTSGVVVGAIPGLTGAMLISLMLPVTFFMEPYDAIVLLVSMYVGGTSGGLVTATLLRMPGSPSNILTTFDGYPMAKSGRPGRALGLGITASCIGGLIAAVVLFTVTKPLSILATRFGAFEYFSLVLMAMVLIASVSQGSLVKGLIAGFLGMLISMPGVDPSTGMTRLTFDYWRLDGGLKLLPVLVGVFAVGQIISDSFRFGQKGEATETGTDGILMSFADLRRSAGNLLRSSLIGTWVGLLPGIGASIGSILAYTTQKNLSKEPEKFGTGSEEGIIASEAANNATVGGALIPLIAMGIPGSVVDAILIAALMMHSISPGPTLFITNGDLVYGMMAAYVVATIAMWVILTYSVRWIARIMTLPMTFLLPVVSVFCMLGAYALSNVFFDVWVMLGFGVLGFLMDRGKFPLGPFVIGFILAPIAESKLRSGLMMTDGDPTPIFTRPFSAAFLIVAILLLVVPPLLAWRKARKTIDLGDFDAKGD